MSVELQMTIGLVATTVALGVLGARLRREVPVIINVMIALALATLVWIPEHWRDVGFAALIGLAIAASHPLIGLGAGMLVWWILGAIPGGGSVLLLGVIVVFGVIEAVSSIRQRLRIARASRMQPGERVSHDVEVAGKVRVREPVAGPGQVKQCAGWWLSVAGTEPIRATSEAPIELHGDDGIALVDPSGAELEFTTNRFETFNPGDKHRERALSVAGLPAETKGTLTIHWLQDGDEMFVVGRPLWEAAPMGIGGGYRDAPVVPVFRATGKVRTLIVDRSEREVLASSTWRIAMSLAWGAACAAIAVIQVFS